MSLLLLFTAIIFCTQSTATNLPFSWDYIPKFAFPGAHDGFLTDKEVKQYGLNEFSQFLIWGFNVSCMDAATNEIYPAKTSGSYYSCGDDHEFYPNMEQSLQYQASQLKQYLTPNVNNSTKVFGYIEATNCQQSYLYQHLFNSDNHTSWHLTLESVGEVNCYKDDCNWQGPSYRQYDHRQQPVRDYFVNSIIYSLLNSPWIDGIFLDSISAWMVTLCPEWVCTETEYNDLYNGSLSVLSETVDLLAKNDKIGTISAHVDLYHYPDYYWKYREILSKYDGDYTMRFYECFGATFWGSSFYNHFVTYLNETASGLAVHYHACKKTLSPSWVELAAFLIGVNNQSYFSYSPGWTVEQQWYQDEYNLTLGEPINDAVCTNDNEWYLFNNTNNIDGDVAAGQNSSDGMIIYIGIYENYQDCFNEIKNDKRSFGSFTWINSKGDVYANMCYGRYTDYWRNIQQSTTISGHLGNLVCSRNFKHCDVELDVLNYNANISWK